MEIRIPSKQSILRVEIPPSKSYAQRAILAAALSTEKVVIKNPGKSKDVLAILEVAKELGAAVQPDGMDYQIQGAVHSVGKELNVGESGLGMRLTTAIAAVRDGDYVLIGEGSLKSRPMNEFSAILPQLGVEYNVEAETGRFRISGNAQPGDITIDGSLSSQYLSGLLMALPLLSGESNIRVNDLKSKPYISITLEVMRAFGVLVKQHNFSHFTIPGNQTYHSTKPFEVEGDYSGASIWMVYGALYDGIQITGISETSVQGDKAILEALSRAGVSYQWKNGNLLIAKSTIKPFEFDATECPDLFPALVVLAAGAKGKSTIKGVQRLIHKESNRAIVLQKEFAKLGLNIFLQNDLMEIEGTGKLNNGTIDSNNDHRIAMAGAIASCLTKNGVEILQAESVAKSYPEFWDNFDYIDLS